MTTLPRDYPRGPGLSLPTPSFLFLKVLCEGEPCPPHSILATSGGTVSSPIAAGPLYAPRCPFEERGQSPAPHLRSPPLCQGRPDAQLGSQHVLLSSEPALGPGPLHIMSTSQPWGHNLPVFHLIALILLCTHIHTPHPPEAGE